MAKAVEVLKNISGQDNMPVNPKGRDIIDLPALKLNVLMIANKIANLKDDTGALASRFTFLKTTQSFYGHEDPSMENQVINHELPGVLNLVLAAKDTIIEHSKSEEMGKEFTEMSSPYSAFVAEYCDTGDDDLFIPTQILWAYYCEWCDANYQKRISAQTFKVAFVASDDIKRCRPNLKDEQIWELSSEHRVDQRPGRRLTISNRPQSYKGIDVKEHLKGEWYDKQKDQEERRSN